MSTEKARRIINNSGCFDVAQKKVIYKALGASESGGTTRFTFSIGKDFPNTTQGDMKYIYVPTDCKLISVGIISTAEGSVSFDIYRSSFEDFNPPVYPSTAESIVGNTSPAITNGVAYRDELLEGWETEFIIGDILAVQVDSVEGEFDSIIILGLE